MKRHFLSGRKCDNDSHAVMPASHITATTQGSQRYSRCHESYVTLRDASRYSTAIKPILQWYQKVIAIYFDIRKWDILSPGGEWGQWDCVTGGRKGKWMLSQYRGALTDWIIINKQKISEEKTNISRQTKMSCDWRPCQKNNHWAWFVGNWRSKGSRKQWACDLIRYWGCLD